MAYEHSIRRYRNWYAKLLRLYSTPHYECFGEGMEQTFNDLLRERAEEGRGLFGCALWMFVETSAEIIKENLTFIIMKTKHIIRIALGTVGILLIPLVAMQFSSEVNWTLSDFIIMGAMLFVTGLMLDLVMRKMGRYRVAAAIAIVGLFLWLWVELAVGLFTNWGS
jgi:hypothetical protein